MADRLKACEKYILLGFSVVKVVRFASVPSSSWYYYASSKDKEDGRKHNPGRPIPGYTVNPDGTIISDKAILDALKFLRSNIHNSNGGGYHKLKYYLRRKYGYYVNHKKIYRLCKENDLLLPHRKKKIKKNRKICSNREIYKPNQLWEFDIKYGYIHGKNRFFFILVYLDVYTRRIVGHYVGLTCKAHNLVATLELAMIAENINDGSDLIIRSDNGSQMTSHQMSNRLEELSNKVTHEFIPCATPNKNAHVESFYSIVESEFIQVHYFKDIKDVYNKFNIFIEYYNNERVHSSILYQSPSEIFNDYEINGFNPKVKRLKV